MKLNDLAIKYRTDKKKPDGVKCQNGLLGHNYTEIYERLFEGKKIKRLLEIGVSFGGSIRMWSDYFPKAEIVGVDIDEKRFNKSELESDKIKIFIGDQADVNFLETLKNEYDVIIDDGCHKTNYIITSFNILFEYLKEGGVYVVEDIHVCKDIVNFFNGYDFEVTGNLLIVKK